jgi:hypothetical protein
MKTLTAEWALPQKLTWTLDQKDFFNILAFDQVTNNFVIWPIDRMLIIQFVKQ